MLRSHFERGVAKLRQMLAAFQGKKVVVDECGVPQEPDECSVQCTEPQEEECLERDLVNFPRPVRWDRHPPVKFGFVPESWFTFLYDKTGVTGPYAFAVSVSTYLVSKEIYILEHNYYNGLSMAAMMYLAVKYLGKHVAAFCDNEMNKELAECQEARKSMLQELEDAIDEERVVQWEAMGQKFVVDAKRQMVAVQLEADFRSRLTAVYNEVKQRLDVEAALANVRKRVNQNHMRGWLATEVASAVRTDTDLQRRILVNCIETLKGLKSRDKDGTSAVAESLTDDELPEQKITTVNMSVTNLEDAEEVEEEEDNLYLS